MNKIIRPAGKPVKRISVDVDVNNQVTVNGQMCGPFGEVKPMSMFDVCVVLSSVLASSLLAIAGNTSVLGSVHKRKPGFKYPDSTGHEFLAAIDNDLICQLCGGHKGNHDGEIET